MNYAAVNAHATCTPETHTLHHILQAVITDGIQRGRDDDLKARAESAARAFRAGLAAFTVPAEPLTGGSINTTLDVTRHYGGAAGYSFGQVGDASSAMAGQLTGIQAHMADAADISARACSALSAFAALQRLADAAGKLPPSPPDAANTVK